MSSLFDGYEPITKPTDVSMTSMQFDLFGGNEDVSGGVNIPGTIANVFGDTKNQISTALNDRTNRSVTNFIKNMIVTSRVYIQRKIADDPSIDDNLACITNQYLGFILAALGLNQVVSGNRTVRDLLNVVATERFKTIEEIACEAFNATMADKKDASPTAKLGDNNKELSFASGKIIEFGINIDGNIKNVSIPVHMVPKIIPDEVAEQFVALNFEQSTRIRFLQVLAGEKSFIRDLVFNMDLIKKKTDALKKDSDNVLYDMLKHTDNVALRSILENISLLKSQNDKSQNLANTVLVFNKQSFMTYAHDAGLNWKNAASRESFFKKSASFMVVLIDPIYAKSEYYWSGLDYVGEYSAKQLKAAKNKDSYDLKDIMAAFTQGVGPKF